MKYLLILTLAAAASAARLENDLLPPHSGSSSGADAGLQTPFSSSGASHQHQSQYQGDNEYTDVGASQKHNQAEILQYINEQTSDGYHYTFVTSDGIKAEQQGRVIPGAQPEEGSLQVTGSYSYVGDDGQTYTVTYTADENGFQPQGAHLPTPPPVPEILKSLQLTAGHGANYDSSRSSYDADNNGY